MEKPIWAFSNVTFFNIIGSNNDERSFIFSDFEHNWDLFQFLTNDNKYYFCLNKNICSKYNFDIIYNTYKQKCKHLNLKNIHFVIYFLEQETFIKNLPIELNYIYNTQFISIFNIDEILIRKFDTYKYGDALKVLNNTNKLCIINKEINHLVQKYTIKRSKYDKDAFSNICFFGASVTAQQYSYVNHLLNNCKDTIIHKTGYSGCHINQAIWLVNDVLNLTPKPKVCVLEWITSVLKPSLEELKCFLDIICKKLLENNIIPIFLYLYKIDINEYLNIVDIYEEIAINYNISSIFLFKAIQNLENIDVSLILKDLCHTVYDGSNLYGVMIQNAIHNIFLRDDSIIFNSDKLPLQLNDSLYNKYSNIQVLNVEQFINNNNMEKIFFNEKYYYKIDDELVINLNDHSTIVLAINILYYTNNGYISINEHKIQTWDKNCYYKRYGYVNLNIYLKNNFIHFKISQETFDTTTCNYDVIFPDKKCLWLSEIIISNI
jgi:hypothetical protein